jgi:capsular polysaccharide biosynthesis protein
MEEEIDLRPYIARLLRQWRTIAVVVAVAVLIGVALAAILPTAYTATADVLILPTRSQLTFDSRFVTNNAVIGTDAGSRRQALIALASSALLEQQAVPKLSSELLGKQYQPGSLARRITVNADGDLLHIEATAPDAQNAQLLADVWGNAYVTSVNDLYGREDGLLRELETQLNQAQQRYDASQQQVEGLVGNSSIVQVSQQISTTLGLLDESRLGTQNQYAQYLSQARDLEATLHDAETLRQQLSTGQTEGLANGLAALALRVRAIGDTQLPIDLRFDDPAILSRSTDATLAELSTLITTLRQRRDALMEQSQQFARSISEGSTDAANSGGLTPALRETYVQHLSELNQQSEQQMAQLKLLRQRRDLALDSIAILQRKIDEQRVALGAPEVQVRFISAVVSPPRSLPVRMVLYGAAAAFAGVFLGLLLAIAQMLLRPLVPSHSPKQRSERPLDRPSAS